MTIWKNTTMDDASTWDNVALWEKNKYATPWNLKDVYGDSVLLKDMNLLKSVYIVDIHFWYINAYMDTNMNIWIFSQWFCLNSRRPNEAFMPAIIGSDNGLSPTIFRCTEWLIRALSATAV